MQDRPIVNAAKVIVSTAIVIPVAIVGILIVLAIIAVILGDATSHGVWTFLAAVGAVAYFIHKDKAKQAKYRQEDIARRESEPRMLTKAEKIEMIEQNIAGLRQCLTVNDTAELRDALTRTESALAITEKLAD
jgi:hypothetical protein